MRSLARLLGLRRGRRFGDYHISRPVHEGEKSLVFEGRNVHDDSSVAVKLYKPAYDRVAKHACRKYAIPSEGRLGMMLTPPEAELSEDHPIVRTLAHGREFGSWTGCHYIVMEFVEGVHLKTLAIQKHSLLREKLPEIAAGICRALKILHDRQLVFRDVNAANVLVRMDGRLKLIDLGFVAPVGIAFTERAGTPSYISPEQIRAEELTPATDVYSFGVLLYEMLTGRLPFTSSLPSDTPEQTIQRRNDIMQKHLSEDPPELTQEEAQAAGAFCAIVQRCTQKDPSKRFPDAGAVLEALQEAAGAKDTSQPD